MKIPAILALALAVLPIVVRGDEPAPAGGEAMGPVALTGSARFHGEGARVADRGPLARAHALSDAFAQPSSARDELDLTLRGTWRELSGSATLHGADGNREPGRARLRFDELAWSGALGATHATLGKRVVSWDVGYAFRPNDIVQQETRRPLLARTLEGRPLAMLEGFGDDSAWAVLAYRKSPRPEDADPLAPAESMTAARVFRRVGAADLHGFAAWGTRSRASLGAAVSWVMNDAIELHASVRRVARHVGREAAADAGALARSDPYVDVPAGAAEQALVGFTWTNEHKISVIGEAWYDGTARSDAFWRQWQARGVALDALGATASPLPGAAAPAAALAGNYGWQAEQLRAGALRRANLLARIMWTHEQWEPALDVLLTPADRGRVVTAALAWRGERVRVEGGARWLGGPAQALYRQTPVRALAYVGVVVSF